MAPAYRAPLVLYGCVLQLFALGAAFDIQLSTKCVPVPAAMGLCQDVGYSEMRLPNLLGQTTMAEVVPSSAQWLPLLHTGCHPHARSFLCSLFAPVCLDTFIQPCRSMCVAVRASCAPVLACHGQSWPESLDCDRFPAGEGMCLASISKEDQYIYREFPKPTCQGCPALEDVVSQKLVLESFCDNNFAVKVKLAKRKAVAGEQEYELEGQVEFISQGLLLPYDTRNLVQQWLLINENCAHKMTRSNRSMVYVIVGDVQHGNVLINRVFHWHRRDSQLALAARKWRHHKC
ncbi:hypothetical protein NDU88_002222 [Pleurodeles waltl]|uniref:Secreted frizzled-related protein 2 n=1 Tax=Pleurodeles waltl TaxID=8319 RepID=A0AAV7SD55_PLEWA|nr:hypothetical protein NDU88_002222 [Pleurodeles waltl]